MTPYTPGGVAIYNIVKETISEVASTADFTFLSKYNTCSIYRQGQIAAVVQDQFRNNLIVTYTRGNEKIKVYR